MARTNEILWEKVKNEIMAKETAGTKAGQWSARKAQMAVLEYKKQGGGYTGVKSSSNPLVKWTKQDWRTKSGGKSSETGERYLPAKAIEALSSAQYKRTSAAKKKGMKAGEQFVKQPEDIAELVKKFR